MSKKCKVEEAVSNVEIAINSGDQDKALGCFEDLKALLKIKKQEQFTIKILGGVYIIKLIFV